MNFRLKLSIAVIVFSITKMEVNAQDRILLGPDIAKKELFEALGTASKGTKSNRRLISDKQTAIAIAEVILFKIYGSRQIISERPYEVYFINGYWVLNGTLPVHYLGGGFLIIISSLDGQVLKVTHYK